MSIKYNGGYLPTVGADGSTLVANSSASTGVSWAGPQFVAGRNKILNGDMVIAQRGISKTVTAGATSDYVLDRWNYINDGTPTYTVSQQAFTPGAAPVAGYEGKYFLRWNQTSAGSGASYGVIRQRIEDVQTFAGQTVTLSFWAKAASAFTLGAPTLNQNFGSGGSSQVTTIFGGGASLTTSWQRFTLTVALPPISGKTVGTGSYLELGYYMPINTTFTFDIWGVQLEAGSVATPFTTATGTLQGELNACQRYYWRSTAAGSAYTRFGNCTNAASTTSVPIFFTNPVPMRTVPTALEYGGSLQAYDQVGGTNISSLGLGTSSPYITVVNATVASGLTQYRGYFLLANNDTTAYVGATAEL